MSFRMRDQAIEGVDAHAFDHRDGVSDEAEAIRETIEEGCSSLDTV